MVDTDEEDTDVMVDIDAKEDRDRTKDTDTRRTTDKDTELEELPDLPRTLLVPITLSVPRTSSEELDTETMDSLTELCLEDVDSVMVLEMVSRIYSMRDQCLINHTQAFVRIHSFQILWSTMASIERTIAVTTHKCSSYRNIHYNSN